MNYKLGEQEWIDAIGGRLHLIYRDVKCLKVIVEFHKLRRLSGYKFISFLNYLYQIIYDRLYVELYKILDNKKGVLSLKNFFYKIECGKSWKDVETHVTYSKIKTKRHDVLAHDNLELALNQDIALTHYENNKMCLSEFMEFLEFLKQKFEDALVTQGEPIFHYALGEEKEVHELKELLLIAFSKDS